MGMNAEVDTFLKGLQHTRKEDIESLYSRISAEFKILESEIKWNAPSFKLKGSNVVTFRLFPEPVFQLILHLGSKKLPESTDLKFEVANLKHSWADSTRCLITIDENFEWEPLQKTITKWLKAVAI
jgi:putative SOS response-associated peptidase YedK